MITEFRIIAEHPDGLHEAQGEINESISRLMTASMKVNPPGEWELVSEQTNEPKREMRLHANKPFVTEQTFRFVAHDNVPVGFRREVLDAADDDAS